MATLTIRGLDDNTRAQLRVRAARNGRSMEEEVRVILRASVSERQLPDGLGTRIHARFAALGGVELELPTREDKPRAAVLDQ